MFSRNKRYVSIFGTPSGKKKQTRWNGYDKFPEDMWHDHDEPCPVCRGRLKSDPIGGFYLKCFSCGWEGW